MTTMIQVLRSSFSTASSVLGRSLALAVVLGLGVAGVGPGTVQAQNTYVVDSRADDPDENLGDGTCQTANDECTFRAALQEAGA